MMHVSFRAAALAAAFSGSLAAASLKPVNPVIPLAFEENRGQSPAPFRYVVRFHNIGFTCSEIDWPFPGLLGHDGVVSVRLQGIPDTCDAQASEPVDSRTHYYRGSHRRGWIDSVAAFRRLRYSSGANTIEYQAQPETIEASITFQNPQAVRLFRIAFTYPRYFTLGIQSQRIMTPMGAWQVRSPQGAVTLALDADTETVSFDVPGAGAGSPVTLLIDMPVTPASLADSTGAFDPQGNWYVTGSSRGFSQLNPEAAICNTSGAYFRCADAFVAKFDRDLRLVYLVYLAGGSLDAGSKLAVDPGGNVYVAGATFSADFPTTHGVVQEQYAGPYLDAVTRLASGGDVFVAKLHGETGGLIYSTYLGLEQQEFPADLQVDATGRPHLLIQSQSPAFPEWGDSLTPSRACSQIRPWPETCTYALALDEMAATVRYSKLAPGARRLHLSPAGNVYLALYPGGDTGGPFVVSMGSDATIRYALSAPPQLSLTDIALAPDESLWLSGMRRDAASNWAGYVLARVDPAGTGWQVTDSGIPGGSFGQTDSAGNLWMTLPGWSLAPPVNNLYAPPPHTFAPTPGAPLPESCGQCDGLVELSPAGAVLFATYLPLSNAQVMVSPDARVMVSGYPLQGGGVARFLLDAQEMSAPLISAVTGPDGQPSFRAGDIVTILGAYLGPEIPVNLPVDAAGRLASEAGGVRVLIDDRPAPIFTAERGRITVMVPQGTPDAGQSMLVVERDGTAVASLPIQLGGRGYAILAGPYAPPGTGILNGDGSVNSAENPAPGGSLVRFYVAAAGPYDQPLVDGELQHATLAKPLETGSIELGLGTPVEMISFQQAPDKVAGIMEVVIRTPRELYGQDPVVELPIIFVFRGIPQLSTVIHSVAIAR